MKFSNSRSHWIIIFSLALTSVLFFLPVLIHPHWGLFDDATLILQPGRRLAVEHGLATFAWLRLRAAIFIWSAFLWHLCPEQPLFFYTINLVIFIATVGCIYANSFRLSQNIPASIFSTSLLFLAPGLFEVIYTLGKQESYLMLLFSVIVSCGLRKNLRPWGLVVVSFVCALCTATSCFSKETSSVLAVFVFVSWALALGESIMTGSVASKRKLIIASTVMLAVLAPLGFAHIYFDVLNAVPDRYVVLQLEPQALLRKLSAYSLVMPQFFCGLAICLIIGAARLSRTGLKGLTGGWTIFYSLLISSVLSAFALVAFDTFPGLLLYIWLPIYTFLLPCVAFAITRSESCLSPNQSIAAALALSVLSVSSIVPLPGCFLAAQFQLAMDQLAARLCHGLAVSAKEAKAEVIAALPIFDIDGSEVPENIEFFTRSILVPGYFSAMSEETKNAHFTMLNFLDDRPEESFLHIRNDLFEMPQFRGRETVFSNECPLDYIGWSGYQLLDFRVRRLSSQSKLEPTLSKYWVRREFPAGALLVVPYGQIAGGTILYRGAGLFADGVENKLYRFPQCRFEVLGDYSKRLATLDGKKVVMGWKLLKVTSQLPIVIPSTSTDGWVKDGAKLFFKFIPQRQILRIDSCQPVSANWVISYPNGSRAGIRPRRIHNCFVCDVPAPASTSPSSFVTLQNNRGESLHIDGLDFVESP